MIMNENELILYTQNQYPKMTLQDHVKRLHQAVFGPGHFHNQPSFDTIMRYLDQEINSMKHYPEDRIEAIGNGYYRVYLSKRFTNEKVKAALSTAFMHSMGLKSDTYEGCIRNMALQLDTLLLLIEAQLLPFNYEGSKQWIDEYKNLGYKAIHHSEVYHLNYLPHYRVIHQSYLSLIED